MTPFRAVRTSSPAACASRTASFACRPPRRSRGRLPRGRSAGSAVAPRPTSGPPSGCGSNRTGRSSHHARGATPSCPTASSVVSRKPAPPGGDVLPTTRKAPQRRGCLTCAEEDSNLHPVIPDQALNLATRVSYASRSRQSVLCVQRSGRNGRIGRNGCCQGCCHGSARQLERVPSGRLGGLATRFCLSSLEELVCCGWSHDDQRSVVGGASASRARAPGRRHGRGASRRVAR